MIRKIRAEFDSIDHAELAARRIKESVGDISRIKIIPKSQFFNINRKQDGPDRDGVFNGTEAFIPFFYPYMGANSTAGIGMLKTDFRLQDSIEAKQHNECIVEVHCKDAVIPSVSSKFVSLAGHNITKI
ncbi:MAG: hypothetical protein WC900_06895 [Oscillospiraceae bacterium]|jgi:hypothetical protein